MAICADTVARLATLSQQRLRQSPCSRLVSIEQSVNSVQVYALYTDFTVAASPLYVPQTLSPQSQVYPRGHRLRTKREAFRGEPQLCHFYRKWVVSAARSMPHLCHLRPLVAVPL